jgi:hypothetical protein
MPDFYHKFGAASPMADSFLAVQPAPLSRIVLAFCFVNSGRCKQLRSTTAHSRELRFTIVASEKNKSQFDCRKSLMRWLRGRA